MQPKSPKLREDIRDAASFICEVTRGRTLDDYSGDRLLRQAVERNFEIVGEAVRRLVQHDSETAARIGDYQQIIAFREYRGRESPLRCGCWGSSSGPQGTEQ